MNTNIQQTLNLDKFIGLALRLIREYNRYKQYETADKIGMSRTYLSEVESGQRRVSYEFIQRYEKVFGLKIDNIFSLAFQLAYHNGAHLFTDYGKLEVEKIMSWYKGRTKV